MMIFYHLAALLYKRASYPLLYVASFLLLGLLTTTTASAQEVEIVHEICLGADIQLTPNTNGDCYRWSSDNPLDNDSNTTNNTFSCPTCPSDGTDVDCFSCPRLLVAPDMTTNYFLVIIDDQGNIVQRERHVVKVNTETFPVSVLTTEPVVCLSEPPGFSNDGIGERNNTCGTATLFMEENYQTYLWSTQETTSEITVEWGGTYGVTVTDENGCQGVGQIQISEDYCVEVTLTATTTAISEGDEAVLTVEENFDTYIWFLDNEMIEGENSNILTADVGGTYRVQVVNELGCLGRSEVVIEEIDEPFIQYTYAIVKEYLNPVSLTTINPVPNTTVAFSSDNFITKRIKDGETLYLCQSFKNNSILSLFGYKDVSTTLSENAQWSESGSIIANTSPPMGYIVSINVNSVSTTMNGSILTVTDGDISISINIVIVGFQTTKNLNHKYAWDAVEDEMANGATFQIKEYIELNKYVKYANRGVPWMFIKGGDKGIATVELKPSGINSLITLEDVENSLNLSTPNPLTDNFTLELNSTSLEYNETLIEAIVEDTGSPDAPFCRCPLVQALSAGTIELDAFYTYLYEENDDILVKTYHSIVSPGDIVTRANVAGNNFLDTSLDQLSASLRPAYTIETVINGGVEEEVIKYIGGSAGTGINEVFTAKNNLPILPINLVSNPTNYKNSINNFYNKIGLNWTLTKKANLIVNYDLNNNRKLKYNEPNEMLKVQTATESIIPNTPSMPGYHEMFYFSPNISPNFGPFDKYYCYMSTGSSETACHELGHSLGHLGHTFEILGYNLDPIANPVPPVYLNKDYYNLMNYTSPSFGDQILRYFQWRKMLLKANFRKDKRKP